MQENKERRMLGVSHLASHPAAQSKSGSKIYRSKRKEKAQRQKMDGII